MSVTVEADTSPLWVNASGASNRGLRRAFNEDAFLAQYPVFLVADGMGGHEAGDVASATVVELFQPLAGRDDVEVHEVLTILQGAHAAVSAATGSDNAGSTLSGVVAVHEHGQRRWLAVNIGDSRVYRLLRTQWQQLTRDHSLAQELLDVGKMRPEELEKFTAKNVITRAIGDHESTVDHMVFPITVGERLLVCTDGLHGEVSDTEMYGVLAREAETGSTAVSLIDRALAGGGRDNITVIVIATQDSRHLRDDDDDLCDETIEIITVPSTRRRRHE